MAVIYLHNTLTNKKEEFKPLRRGFLAAIGLARPQATMYHCGPTVYNYLHIGNMRAAVFADTTRRLFESAGYRVKQVMNITDIGHLVNDADEGEDKMTKALLREGKPLTLESMKELADFYTGTFVDDIRSLNVELPHYMPKASEHIVEDIAIIRKLEAQGLTYTTSDSVYFDTSKIDDYGRLGGISNDPAGATAEGRIAANPEKKNPRDFSLWKLNPQLGWESPWGKGFPGWHIECSAMSMKYLGESFDIHTGGIEHIAVHHNNEIAQSEHATHKQFARYWLHNAHIVLANEKMAKSVGNVVYIKDIKARSIDPMALRYFFLGGRYSTQLNFTWEALEASATAYKRLQAALRELPDGGKARRDLFDKALAFVADDLDTPKALALCWDILKDTGVAPADKKVTILAIDKMLGLSLEKTARDTNGASQDVPGEVKALVEARKTARESKDWKRSDELRDQIVSLGFDVKDTPEGQKVFKK